MDEPEPSRVVRPPDAWLGWVLAGFALLVGAWAVLRRPVLDATLLTMFVLFGAVAAVGVRTAGARIDYFDWELLVRNPFSTFSVRFDEIDDVTTAPYLTYMVTARVRFNGRVRPLYALQGRRPRWVGSGDEADRLLEELRAVVRGGSA